MKIFKFKKINKNTIGETRLKFFDKILNIIGFDVDENPKQPKKQRKPNKTKIGEVDLQDISGKVDETEIKKNSNMLQQQSAVRNSSETTDKIINLIPQNQNEVQSAMDILKSGKNIIIDLSAFKASDVLRALDFISGVCYCLNARIQRLGETTFALTLE